MSIIPEARLETGTCVRRDRRESTTMPRQSISFARAGELFRFPGDPARLDQPDLKRSGLDRARAEVAYFDRLA